MNPVCLSEQEVNRVSEVVTSLADPSANVIFGAVIDDQYEGGCMQPAQPRLLTVC